jgi:3',5'-nucleoside bisphosphate phosphatase
MSPQNITAQAAKQNVRIISICDHNTAENVAAVMKAAEAKEVVVLPGMEVCSSEEIHVLAVFENLESAIDLQAEVYDRLQGKNDPEAFGLQVVSNELDEVMGFQDKLLIGAVDLSIEQIVAKIHQRGGVAIASHIDRESYSVVGQLGFIPESLTFDALELSCHIEDDEARRRFAAYAGSSFIRNSDAHFLDDVGTNTSEYLLECPTFPEIRLALQKKDGRQVCVS